MQRLISHLHAQADVGGGLPYVMNLDPAVRNVPYHANIDIRDTVDYRQVMEHYNLGPNGAIMTSLNLFTTKFDQVLQILDRQCDSKTTTPSHVLIDTPGQIEIFQWSASGSIITDTLATSFPTCIAYVVDTPRSASPVTFMSSMLYATSILYKSRLPLIVVFNKTDVVPDDTVRSWMRDFEAFQAALKADEAEEGYSRSGGGSSGYMSSLMNSMSLMLEEFYRHLDVVSVSAVTGAGMSDFDKVLRSKIDEYWTVYRPEIDRLRAEQEKQLADNKQQQLDALVSDMQAGKQPTLSDQEEEEDDVARAEAREKAVATPADPMQDDDDGQDEYEEGQWVESDDEDTAAAAAAAAEAEAAADPLLQARFADLMRGIDRARDDGPARK